MNKIREHLQSFLQDKLAQRRLLYYFLVTLIFFSAFLKLDFATDTYAELFEPGGDIVANFLRGGRIITCLFFVFFKTFHVNIYIVNLASFLLAVISLTLGLYILEKIIHQNFKKLSRTWVFFLPILILINPFIIELFLFIEKGIMVLGILLCVIATYFYNRYLNERSRSDIYKAIVFNIVASLCYQGVIGIFIVLAATLTILNFKQWKQFLRDTILSAVIYVIGPLVSLILIKILSSGGRTSGAIYLSESLRKIAEGTIRMLDIFNIMPSTIFWGFVIVMFLIWVSYILKPHQPSAPRPFIMAVSFPYIFIVLILAGVAPQFVQQTSTIWIVSRSTYAFASAAGIFALMITKYCPKITTTNPWRTISVFSAIVLLAVEVFYFNQIELDHYSIAEIDRLRAQEIGRLINEYEQTNNITISTITPSNDQQITYSYPGIFVLGDSNISSFNTDWSDINSISFWNGRRFYRDTPTPEWEAYCKSHDWHDFNLQQVEFDQDILRICWY